MSNNIKLEKYFHVKQPFGDFLVCSLNYEDFVKISSVDPRKYNEELDDYIGIQRDLHPQKVMELKKYVCTKDATFPNSIITSLDLDFFEKDGDDIYIDIFNEDKPNKKALSILDGQHRIAAFKENVDLYNLKDDFELLVVIYLGLDIEEQAYLFSIINNKQKALNSSLVQDLNSIFKLKTPEKIVHIITNLFNKKENSPWKNKIKILGKDVFKNGEKVKGIISQYSFSKQILDLIYSSKDYLDVRDILNRDDNDRSKLVNYYNKPRIFWEYYSESKDKELFEMLLNYFNAIENNFKDYWGVNSSILTKTTGYIAFMKFLKFIISEKQVNLTVLNYEYFNDLFDKISKCAELLELTSENYESGGKGQTRLFNHLKKAYEFNN